MLSTITRLYLVAGFFFTAAVFADLGDDFETYVNAVLPQSHAIARGSSSVIENSLIVFQASVAQSELHLASEDAIALEKQLKTLQNATIETAEFSDSQALFQQLGALSQIANLAERIQKRLSGYEQIVAGWTSHCEDPASFENYHIESLNLTYAIPNYELFNGVRASVVISTSDGSMRAGGGGGNGVEDIPIVGPIVTFLKNNGIKNHISDQADRLREKQPTTTHYRRYAQENCRTAAKQASAGLAVYDSLIVGMKKIPGLVPLDIIQNARAFLMNILNEHLKAGEKLLTETPRLAAAGEKEKLGDGLFNDRLAAKMNVRIPKIVARLKGSPCGKGHRAVEALQSDIELGELYELSNRERLLPAVREILRKRGVDCPGETI